MKNIIAVNFQNHEKYPFEKLEKEMKAQIENSLQLGWNSEDILLVTNFEYSFMGINAFNIPLNDFCLTGTKVFVMRELFKRDMIKGVVWIHDLDVWQVHPFECPNFADVGISTYSNIRKFNGGTQFYKPESIDIVYRLVEEIERDKSSREEPSIQRVFNYPEYSGRITTLNNTYNLGCSGYVKRFERSVKPVKAVHFHPSNRIAWSVHCRDRNRLGTTSVSKRLYNLFLKYFKDDIKNYEYKEEKDKEHRGNYEPPKYILKSWEND